MATQTIAAYNLNYGSQTKQAAERNIKLLAAQQRARRGPTPEVFIAKRLDNSRLVKAADPVRVREMRVFTAALSVLFVFVSTGSTRMLVITFVHLAFLLVHLAAQPYALLVVNH